MMNGAPVAKRQSSPARNSAVCAISSGVPKRPNTDARFTKLGDNPSGPAARSAISVWMKPGQMQFARMLYLPYSSAATRVRLITPAFAAQYAVAPFSPTMPATDAVLMTTPPPRLTICGSAYFIPSQTPRKLIAMTRFELFFGHLGHERAVALDPRVVENDVEAAVLRDGFIDHRLRVNRFRNVRANREALPAFALDAALGVLRGLVVDVRRGDFGALAREQHRRRAAHPGSRTCDQRNFVLELRLRT